MYLLTLAAAVLAVAPALLVGSQARRPETPVVLSKTDLGTACEPTPYGRELLAKLPGAPARGGVVSGRIGGAPARGGGVASAPQPNAAEVQLRAAVTADPNNPVAALDLARCLWFLSRAPVQPASALGQLRLAAELLSRAQASIERQAPTMTSRLPAGVARTPKTTSPPEYPGDAFRDGVSGTVFVEVTIDAKGDVRNARAIGSIPELDDAAVKSVKKWKFEPLAAGGPTETVTIVPMRFRQLTDQKVAEGIDATRFLLLQGSAADAPQTLRQSQSLLEADLAELQAREEAWQACSGRARRIGQPSRDNAAPIPPPTKIVNVPFVYPEVSRAAREQGVVFIEAVIDEEGSVACSRILRSASPNLDNAALAAVREWKYTATLVNGAPVPILMTVTVNFSLN